MRRPIRCKARVQLPAAESESPGRANACPALAPRSRRCSSGLDVREVAPRDAGDREIRGHATGIACPDWVLTTRFRPSIRSTVPRMRIGIFSAVWASVGRAATAASSPVKDDNGCLPYAASGVVTRIGHLSLPTTSGKIINQDDRLGQEPTFRILLPGPAGPGAAEALFTRAG